MEKIIDTDAHLALIDCFDHPDIPKEWTDGYRRRHPIVAKPFRGQHFAVTENWKTMLYRAKSQKITKQVINHYGLTTGLNYREEPALAVRLMQIYNDRMIKLSHESEGFFLPVAWLALQDPEACLREIERLQQSPVIAFTIDDLVAVGQWSPGKRIIKEITASGRPIYIHFTTNDHMKGHSLPNYEPLNSNLSKLIHSYNWSAQCSLGKIQWFMEMLTGLVNQKWFHDEKQHRFVLAERGIDWIKQYCDFAKKYLNLDLLSIFQSRFWFTIEPEHKGFKQDAEHLGWNRLLYATDQGHDQGDCGGANAGNDISTIAGLNLTNDQQDLIYFRNFEQCFKPVF